DEVNRVPADEKQASLDDYPSHAAAHVVGGDHRVVLRLHQALQQLPVRPALLSGQRARPRWCGRCCCCRRRGGGGNGANPRRRGRFWRLHRIAAVALLQLGRAGATNTAFASATAFFLGGGSARAATPAGDAATGGTHGAATAAAFTALLARFVHVLCVEPRNLGPVNRVVVVERRHLRYVAVHEVRLAETKPSTGGPFPAP
ncbi:unnamed protein product, partial [Ectocarpus sp. 8 AP-2014]